MPPRRAFRFGDVVNGRRIIGTVGRRPTRHLVYRVECIRCGYPGQNATRGLLKHGCLRCASRKQWEHRSVFSPSSPPLPSTRRSVSRAT